MKVQLEECCGNKAKDRRPPSVINSYEPVGSTARRVAPSGNGQNKLHSEVVDRVKSLNRFQLIVKIK